MNRYSLIWEYGTHHVYLDVTESNFNAVIDDLSSEFEININDCKVPNGNAKEYSIIDYLGDKYIIGYIYY